MKKPKERKKKVRSIKKVREELDKVFSIYSRNKEVKNGLAACVSCGTKKDPKELQCGHYVSRMHLSVRWDERNGWPQCPACNIFKKGNYPAYTDFLINRFGVVWLQNLIKEGRMIRKWTLQELEDLLTYYKSKI